jgi:DNA mismatch repair protein MSH5
MAHIGSFIPARSAVIGLTDRILTRLPGMESVAQHTSSFMADLAQVGGYVHTVSATHRVWVGFRV